MVDFPAGNMRLLFIGHWWPNIREDRAMITNLSLIVLLQEAQEALDVLAQDAEEAGYPVRAESATELAMRIRSAVLEAKK
jgi:Tfp pilus assembly protein PilW